MIKVFKKITPFRSRVRGHAIAGLALNIVLISVILGITGGSAFACACGCDIFGVGTPWTMPTKPGASLFLQYSYMDQSRNWHGQGPASPDLNDDKNINTSFYTLGGQYMINRNWGVRVEIPFWDRYFRTSPDGVGLASVDEKSLADINLLGMYTGFSPNMSTALEFGLKLPTGPHTQALMDRDTQIGTGTTDLLLGGYHLWQWEEWGAYVQAMYSYALNKSDEYRPGDRFNAAIGAHYDSFEPDYRIVPLATVKASFRGRDSGENADPDNTGYQRLFVSPGFEVTITKRLNFYADVDVPVYTHVNGFQLVAPLLVNTSISYNF